MFSEEETPSLHLKKLFRAACPEAALFSELLFAGFVLKSLERFGMSVERTALVFICRSCSVFIIRAWTVLRGEEDIGVSTCNSSLCCVVLPWL